MSQNKEYEITEINKEVKIEVLFGISKQVYKKLFKVARVKHDKKWPIIHYNHDNYRNSIFYCILFIDRGDEMSQPIQYKDFTYYIDCFAEYAQARTYSKYLGLNANFLGRDKDEAERNIINAIDKGEIWVSTE